MFQNLLISIKRLKSYLTETIKLIKKNPRYFNKDLIRYLPNWWSSLNFNKSPLTDNQPWISFAAIQFLKNILKKDMRVYEYGSGGSTLFFASRVNNVISTEHNRNWYNTVVEEINHHGIHNCQIRLFEPTPEPVIINQDVSDPDAYISGDENYRGMSFKNYASSIDMYPDEYFDVVFIDGRSRPSCFKHAMEKVKRYGYLVLDNAEIPYYFYVHESLNNGKWGKNDFSGPFPYLYHFSETCIWQKLEH